MSYKKKSYIIILLVATILVLILELLVYSIHKGHNSFPTNGVIAKDSLVVRHDSVESKSQIDTVTPSKPIQRTGHSDDEEITTEVLSGEYQTATGYFDNDSLTCNYIYVKSPSCGTCNDGVVKANVTWKGKLYFASGSADSHGMNLKLYQMTNSKTVKVGNLNIYGNNSEGYEGITLRLRGKDYGEYRHYYDNE